MTVKRITTVLLCLILMVTVVLFIFSLLSAEWAFLWNALGGMIVFGVVLLFHLYGWKWSQQALVILATIFTVVGNPADITLRQISFTVLAPVVLAAILLPWYWGISAYVVCMIGIAIQSGGQGPLFQSDVLSLATFTAIGISFAGFVARSAQHTAEQNAIQLAQALAQTEAQAKELADANDLMSDQLDQQAKLLSLVDTLETPVVPLADGMLLAPIIGYLDTRRSEMLTKRMLQAANEQRAKIVVLDIAGVAMIDTAVARALIHLIQALRLLGCEVVLSGISANVAMSLIHLNVNLGEIHSVRSPQEALSHYFSEHKQPSARDPLSHANAAPARLTSPLLTNGNGHTLS